MKEIQAHLGSCAACGTRLREVKEFHREADRIVGVLELPERPPRRPRPRSSSPPPSAIPRWTAGALRGTSADLRPGGRASAALDAGELRLPARRLHPPDALGRPDPGRRRGRLHGEPDGGGPRTTHPRRAGPGAVGRLDAGTERGGGDRPRPPTAAASPCRFGRPRPCRGRVEGAGGGSPAGRRPGRSRRRPRSPSSARSPRRIGSMRAPASLPQAPLPRPPRTPTGRTRRTPKSPPRRAPRVTRPCGRRPPWRSASWTASARWSAPTQRPPRWTAPGDGTPWRGRPPRRRPRSPHSGAARRRLSPDRSRRGAPQLGGPVHVIEGMSAMFMGLAQGKDVPRRGSDPAGGAGGVSGLPGPAHPAGSAAAPARPTPAPPGTQPALEPGRDRVAPAWRGRPRRPSHLPGPGAGTRPQAVPRPALPAPAA